MNNERIKDIAVECIVETINDSWVFNDAELEKFSLLIVQECLRMCEVAAWGHTTHGHHKEAEGALSVQHFIEQHFEIEE